jgi:ParB family chromosome partitioning protein
MARATGLGRGLSALMDEVAAAGSSDAGRAPPVAVPISRIVAHAGQPRRRFDVQAMTELTDSIRERGVLQPILVRPLADDRYEIVAGERRWRAAQAAGLHEIPVVVRKLDDVEAYEIALIENIQRADLNPIEEAEGYARLIHDHGHTQEAVSKVVGKARSHIANLLRLLDLPELVRAMVVDGRLSMGHARALAATPDPVALANRAIAEGLSVRQVEALARKPAAVELTPARARQATSSRDPNLTALEAQIAEATGIRVTVAVGETPEVGTVTLNYASLDQLDLICQRLGGGNRF